LTDDQPRAVVTCDDVRCVRDALNMDQSSFAAYLGLSRTVVSLVECGHRQPSRHMRLAVALLRREIGQRGTLRDWPQVY